MDPQLIPERAAPAARLSRTGFFVHLLTLAAGAGMIAAGLWTQKNADQTATCCIGATMILVGFFWGVSLLVRGRREKNKTWVRAFGTLYGTEVALLAYYSGLFQSALPIPVLILSALAVAVAFIASVVIVRAWMKT